MLILKGRSRGLKKPGFFLNISVGGKSGSFMGDKLKELRAIAPTMALRNICPIVDGDINLIYN